MTWYAVYNTPDGSLYSTTQTEPVGLPGNYGYVAVGETQPGGVWNPATLSFDPRPAVPETITRFEFLQRFTQSERIAIRNSADDKIRDFWEIVQAAEDIPTGNNMLITAMNYIEAQGLIANGRADEILNG